VDRNTIERAAAWTERYVAKVTPDQYGWPTPCTAWDVRALLNHLLGVFMLHRALMSDTPPDVAMAPGGLPAVDLVGDDVLKAYRLGVEGALSATTPDAVDRVHTTPLGAMPGSLLSGFGALDILVHGWDLATATGQDATLDPQLAEALFGFARQSVPADNRPPQIGPEVAIRADAPVTQRLVAFLGRTP
jgi:uncharacterized protein (TIGR03086 family)